jgi:hypothetical protein
MSRFFNIIKKIIKAKNFTSKKYGFENNNGLMINPITANDSSVDDHISSVIDLSEVLQNEEFLKKTKKSLDLENEINSLQSSSNNSYNENNGTDDLANNLYLHHDHITKHLFRHMNHFSEILQQLYQMRK